jgi:hypothetical protein
VVPALVVPALAPPVAAQQRATSRIAQAGPVPELRAEAAFGRDAGTVAGAGLFADAGLYARVGVTAAGGVVWADTPAGRRARGVGEVALVGRFLLDPLRAASRGVYAGGGLGVRVADGASRTSARSSARPFLLGVVGVEGRRGPAGLAPAVELGVGGGRARGGRAAPGAARPAVNARHAVWSRGPTFPRGPSERPTGQSPTG